MTPEQLDELAEGDDHARWIVDHHTRAGSDTRDRGRCSVCDQWWPCDLLMLAALAVLRKLERDALADELSTRQKPPTSE